MSQVRIVSLVSILPLLILGCGSQNSEPSTSSQPVPPVLPKVATDPNASPSPLAVNSGTRVAQGNAGLIPSTNPEVRSKAVAAGNRNDPFRSFSVSPDIKLSKEALKAAQDPSKPPQPPSTIVVRSPGGFLPGVTGRGSAGRPASLAPRKPLNPPVVPQAPPPPPSTELAKAVEITGVVQTGQSVVAIVRAPEEPTSRNVQAGDRISNGQVLVKRISLGIAGNPTVVLEQNGIEVIKSLSNSIMG